MSRLWRRNPPPGQPRPRSYPPSVPSLNGGQNSEASGRGGSLGRADMDLADPGMALDVRADDELPSAIRWRGAWHPIEHIALSWQLDLNWWNARVYRDYYKVLAAGMALVIYHDLLTDAWALQRVYD